MAKWTRGETRDVIRLYNRMIKLHSQNKLGPSKSKGQTSKAALVAAFIEKHPERSRGSVESKLMNVSYCRQLAGLPVVPGYAPLSNCSNDLLQEFDVVRGEEQ